MLECGLSYSLCSSFFFSSRRRHTRCALVTGVQTCALPICAQLKAYEDWTRAQILPRARSDHRLPPALYADNLKQVGVTDLAPDELIRRAQLSFVEIQNEMRALAPLVARQNGYKSDDYRDVIRELKKDQISGDAILPLYRDTLKTIEARIRREPTAT